MIRALIVACDEDDVIGVDGDLPWRLPSELRLFRRETMGRPLIVGRRTWASLGGPLDGRPTVVVSSTLASAPGCAAVARSLSHAWSVAERLCAETGADTAFVAGGEALYRVAVLDVEEAYVTRVHGRFSPEGAPPGSVARFPWGALARRLPRATAVARHHPSEAEPVAWTRTTYRVGRGGE